MKLIDLFSGHVLPVYLLIAFALHKRRLKTEDSFIVTIKAD